MMFRPAQEHSLFRHAPFLAALSIILLFGLLATTLWTIGLIRGGTLVGLALPGFGVVHGPLVGLSVLVLLTALGALLFAGIQNYREVTHTVERVKSFMRNILQSIPTGVLTLDPHGRVTSLNSAAEQLLGLRASMVAGRSVDDLLHSASDLGPWIRSVMGGNQLIQETNLSLSSNGDRRLTLRASASELRDESGKAEGLVILLRDITEVSRLELQLRRADKLAALGTLASGVAHEVKNPLYAVNLNLHLLAVELESSHPSQGEIKGYLDILRSEIQRIHRIVENFLRFSRPSLPEVKPLDLNALIERILSLVAFEAADHGITIETHLDPTLDSVPADEGQLTQVLLNLVINAVQAMPSGGTLTVSTQHENGRAHVTVKDTGEGIKPEVLPHVFDPYFTTRPSGAGLGLAITHRIVEGHRGAIDVESTAGEGTTMTVRLPLEAAMP